MPAYRINIDGRIYEGHYGSKSDAVYGAMRKDEIDLNRAIYAGVRQCSKCTELDSSWYNNPDRTAIVRERQAKRSAEAKKPSLIGVEEIKGKVPKKIRRVLQDA